MNGSRRPSPAFLDRRDLLAGAGSVVLARYARPALAAAPDSTVLEAKTGPSETLGYNGTAPGPLLRIRKGETLAVRLKNTLPAPTTLSWHGVRNINAMDGVEGLTQAAVTPGGTFDYRFTPPDSGLFWYHPHVTPNTAGQTGRGLYGVLIVDEPEPPPVDADLLLLLGDGPGGSVLVNGRAAPLTPTVQPGARLRLRLVNACVSRIAFVAVTAARVTAIAIDGQPSEVFQPAAGTVPMGPGSRFELMLDVAPAANAKVAAVLRGLGDEAEQVLMVATTAGDTLPARPAFARLPPNPLLPARIALQKASRHTVIVAAVADGRWSVNGTVGRPAKPLFAVPRGTPVTLTFRNATDLPQQMHVHGHCWRLLHDLDDGWDPYWRDSVLLAPGKTKHVAFVADNPGRWALGSGDLRRQDAGLETWFEVR